MKNSKQTESERRGIGVSAGLSEQLKKLVKQCNLRLSVVETYTNEQKAQLYQLQRAVMTDVYGRCKYENYE